MEKLVILEIKKIVSEHRLDFDAASINDFDNVRNKIVYVLIKKIKNVDFLKSVPNIDFVGDMVVIFKYELCDGDLAGNATITVTNALQEMWGVTTDTLLQCAKKQNKETRKR